MERLKANSILNCDCLDLMDEILRGGVELTNGETKNKVDWVLTDCPYGISIEKMSFTQSGAVKTKNAKAVRNDYSNIGKWDNERISKECFDKMFAVSDNQIFFGCNYYSDILPPTKSILCWDKKQCQKAKGLPNLCHMSMLCAKAYNRMKRR